MTPLVRRLRTNRLKRFSFMNALASFASVRIATNTGHASSPSNRRSQVSRMPSMKRTPPGSLCISRAASRSTARSVVKPTRQPMCPPIVARLTACSGGSVSTKPATASRSGLSACLWPMITPLSTSSATRIGSVPSCAVTTSTTRPSSATRNSSGRRSVTGRPFASVTSAYITPRS